MSIKIQVQEAKKASKKLAKLNTAQKNEALVKIAEALLAQEKTILKANEQDLKVMAKKGKSAALQDRVILNHERLSETVKQINEVISLPDPIGQGLARRVLPNGLELSCVRVPLGTIFMIIEARPNVTVDAVVLSLKSANALILKGGSDALKTNLALVKVIKGALTKTRVPQEAFQFISLTSYEAIRELLSLKDDIDVVIPRGGKDLFRLVQEKSEIPLIGAGMAVVHTFVDETADLAQAAKIVFNAKAQRPSICNALDTLLVHKKIARKFLPQAAQLLKKKKVEIRACSKSYALLKKYPFLKKARSRDWDTEYLDLILGVRVVKDLNEALRHIEKHSLKHSEAIITQDFNNAERFLNEVDAACVYVNTSTRFTDGSVFGLGAEIGISTQKLHVRGPFALEGLTSFKWLIRGQGQIRK